MERGFFSLFAYGALYSLAGAGCTAPLFIGVIIQALSKGGFLSGMTVFIAYAAGLALFLIIVTLLITGAKEGIIIKMKRAIPYIGKIGGLILLIVGTWLILQYFFPTLI
jgi:cytochrome c biogenesis protein CcdA